MKSAEFPSMSNGTYAPPGKHPIDPCKKDIDPLAFALDHIQTSTTWIVEHLYALEKETGLNRDSTRELEYLHQCIYSLAIYTGRLTELVFMDYTINRELKIPIGLSQGSFDSLVKRLKAVEDARVAE